MAIDALMRRVAPEEIGKPLRKADTWPPIGVDVGAYPYGDEVPAHAEVVSTLSDDTARIFAECDADAAVAPLNQTDELKDRYEELMLSQLTSGASAREAVALALLYCYIHRIIAHFMNVMTAVVMPLDRLDYWDEDKADRD
ncbi:MAG: hypothetical protein R6X29_03960 [Acidimicrobiia bacterium]|jgi:phosphate uptake regulator